VIPAPKIFPLLIRTANRVSAGLACAGEKNQVMAIPEWREKEENDASMIAKAAFKP